MIFISTKRLGQCFYHRPSHTKWKGNFPMADQIVTWRLNSATKQVEIMQGSRVVEVTTLAQTPARLAFHRAEVAKADGATFVEARPHRRAA